MLIDPEKWTPGKVIGQTRWTDRLFSIRVAADLPPFTAGQFTKLALPMDIGQGEELVARSYSFVNAPDQRPHEFYYILVDGGPLTARLGTLKADDLVYVYTRPAGFLILDEAPPKKHLWMLATGTGLGPFLSILKGAEPWSRFERVVLVHAVRQAEELTYGDNLRSLLEAHPRQMTFIPFVSRQQAPAALEGRVPAAITDGRLERRAGLPLAEQDSAVMICGNPAMVKDTQTALQARGLKRHRRHSHGNFFVENYW